MMCELYRENIFSFYIMFTFFSHLLDIIMFRKTMSLSYKYFSFSYAPVRKYRPPSIYGSFFILQFFFDSLIIKCRNETLSGSFPILKESVFNSNFKRIIQNFFILSFCHTPV